MERLMLDERGAIPQRSVARGLTPARARATSKGRSARKSSTVDTTKRA